VIFVGDPVALGHDRGILSFRETAPGTEPMCNISGCAGPPADVRVAVRCPERR
jgi:hypothetical protein